MAHEDSYRYPVAFGGHPLWACVKKALDHMGSQDSSGAHAQGSWMEGFISFTRMWRELLAFAWRLLFG